MSENKDSLYIVMPAYNEEANIEQTVRDWYPLLKGPGSKLIVADSGSSDATHEILERLQKEFEHLEILTDCDRQHGPKVMALYKKAVTEGADFVFQTDSDGQTNPAEFKAFWNNRNNCDGIFGNRTVRGDGKDRAFVEVVVCILLRIFFGVKVPDANAPFRLMKVSTLAKYIDRLPEDYFLPNIMMTTYFVYYKERYSFRTISFKPRSGGKNSINLPRIIQIGWKALGDFYRLRKAM